MAATNSSDSDRSKIFPVPNQPQQQIPSDSVLPGQLIQMYRMRLRLTQGKLASLLELSSARVLPKWENSESLPKAERLRKLIEVLIELGAFDADQEYNESLHLWNSIKTWYDNTNGRFLTYPVFDQVWFERVLNQKSNRPHTEIPASSRVKQDSNVTTAKRQDAVRTNLPQNASLPLIGRAKELVQIVNLLNDNKVRLVTLTGIGGIGKTRLSFAVARKMLNPPDGTMPFVDGVWFVNLQTVHEAALVLPTIAYALGLRESSNSSSIDKSKIANTNQDTTQIVKLLLEHVRERQILIVLDNFEQIIEAGSDLVSLLEAAAELKLLVTSREVLKIYQEYVYQVPPLVVPDARFIPKIPLEQLKQNPAVALFIERAKQQLTDFELDETNKQAIAELSILLEGLPLPIELAAGRMRAFSPHVLVDKLKTRKGQLLQILINRTRNIAERQYTLQATLDWSYQLLLPPERAVFRRLGAFMGSFSLDGVMQVCADLLKDEIETEQTINGLLDKSMITSVQRLSRKKVEDKALETNSKILERYSLLEIVREYAMFQMDAAGEVGKVHAQYTTYYQNLARQAVEHLVGFEEERWLELLEVEHDNFKKALDWLLEQKLVEQALNLSSTLGNFWLLQSYFSEGRYYLERSLELCKTQSQNINGTSEVSNIRHMTAKALYWAANLAERQGNYNVALTYIQESLEWYRSLNERQGIVDGLNCLARVVYVWGNHAEAEKYLEEGLRIAQELDYKEGMSASLNRLGNIAHRRGDFQKAINYFHRSQILSQEIGDVRYVAGILNNLGIIAINQGRYDDAKGYYQESLSIRQRLGDKQAIALSLNNLGNVAYNQSTYEAASHYYKQSLAIQEEIGDEQSLALSLNNLGRVKNSQGNYREAIDFFEKSLAIRRQIHDKTGVAASLNNLGQIACIQEAFTDAYNYLSEGLSICWEIGDKKLFADTLSTFVCLEVHLSLVSQSSSNSHVHLIRAVHLGGVIAELSSNIGIRLEHSERDQYELALKITREHLGDEIYKQAFVEGAAMPLTDVVNYTLK